MLRKMSGRTEKPAFVVSLVPAKPPEEHTLPDSAFPVRLFASESPSTVTERFLLERGPKYMLSSLSLSHFPLKG